MAAVRQSKSVQDVLDDQSQPLAEELREFEELLKKELPQASVAETPPQEQATDPAESEAATSEAFKMVMQDILLKRNSASLTEEATETLKLAERKCRVLLDAHVELHVMPESNKDMSELLSKSPAASTRGDHHSGLVMVWVDLAQTGEPITAPHTRVCPMNSVTVKRFCSGVVKSRDNSQRSLHPGDLWCFWDCGQFNLTKAVGCLTNEAGEKLTTHDHCLTLSYDYESLRATRAVNRASATINQIEHCSLITAEPFIQVVKEKSRAHFRGSSHGNYLGPALKAPLSERWQLTVKAGLPYNAT